MTTIAIIGGHGKIGLLTTRELAAAGHTVLSVIRNPDQMADVVAAGATAVVLDIETATGSELATSISGAEAIIFTAGAGGGSGPARKETVDHQGAVTSMAAAGELGIDRFVQVSYIGADDPTYGTEDPSFAAYQRAKAAADDALRASSLAWTIVRPGTLTDGPRTGLVTIDESLTSGETSRANVPALLAVLAGEKLAIGKVLNVIEGHTDIHSAILGA
jgi:uncharacterized protein YbjT (DUF2867 family)